MKTKNELLEELNKIKINSDEKGLTLVNHINVTLGKLSKIASEISANNLSIHFVDYKTLDARNVNTTDLEEIKETLKCKIENQYKENK